MRKTFVPNCVGFIALGSSTRFRKQMLMRGPGSTLRDLSIHIEKPPPPSQVELRLRYAILLNQNIFLHLQMGDLRQLMLNPHVIIHATHLSLHEMDMLSLCVY